MYRKAIFVVSALVLSAGAVPARPAFEYRGFKAGEQADKAKLRECGALAALSDDLKRSYQAAGIPLPDPEFMKCRGASAVAGVPVTGEEISFYKGRLSGVLIFAETGYSTLTDALTAKYGKPCQSGVKSIENRMGAKFPSPYFVWCFSSGNLTAEMNIPSIDTMTIQYTDAWQPPKPAVKVDF